MGGFPLDNEEQVTNTVKKGGRYKYKIPFRCEAAEGQAQEWVQKY